VSIRADNVRLNIAEEAARLIIEGGMRDYQLAKRKAAQRLGVIDRGGLPTNLEIEEAVMAHQRLFRADSQPRKLTELREAAIHAMEFLADFEPRLTGAVLSGSADEHSYVELHLFTDSSEEVAMLLMDHSIPYESGDKRLRMTPQEHRYFPTFRFLAGETPIELLVMPNRASRQPPLSPITRQAMRRVTLVKFRRLLERETRAC
jgi:predicted nucleotidyltransferase